VKGREFLGLAGPSAVIMVALMLLPMLMLVGLSFHRFSYGSDLVWTGLDNYAATLGSRRFWDAVSWSLTYIAVTVPLELALGLAVAMLLNQIGRGRGLLMAAILLPFIVTPVVGTLVFSWLFKDSYGFLWWVLSLVGIEVSWGAESWSARTLLIVYRIWQATAFPVLVFFAGLQSLPMDRMEAAAIDGATAWQRFRHVVLPHLRPLMVFVAMIAVMDNWREFDSVFVMTQGGPGNSTATIMYLNYAVSFTEQALGRGAAISVLTVFGIAILLSPFVIHTWREQRGR
jgi:ABC-type sugar transport system permease subunit